MVRLNDALCIDYEHNAWHIDDIKSTVEFLCLNGSPSPLERENA